MLSTYQNYSTLKEKSQLERVQPLMRQLHIPRLNYYIVREQLHPAQRPGVMNYYEAVILFNNAYEKDMINISLFFKILIIRKKYFRISFFSPILFSNDELSWLFGNISHSFSQSTVCSIISIQH